MKSRRLVCVATLAALGGSAVYGCGGASSPAIIPPADSGTARSDSGVALQDGAGPNQDTGSPDSTVSPDSSAVDAGGDSSTIEDSGTVQDTSTVQDSGTVQDTSTVDTSTVQDTSTVEDTSTVQDTSTVEDTSTVQDSSTADTSTIQDTGTTQDTGTAQDTSTAQDTATDAPTTGFAGRYVCNVTEDVNVTAPIVMVMNTMVPASMVVTETGTVITATLMGDGGLDCALTFKDNGNGTATLNPATGQTCNVTASTVLGPEAVLVTFTGGGTAILMSPSLKADNLPISVADGPGDMLGIMGTGKLSADCTRM